MKEVFVSHCRKDETGKVRGIGHLGALAADGQPEVRDDLRVAASEDGSPTIEQAIRSCDVAILRSSAWT